MGAAADGRRPSAGPHGVEEGEQPRHRLIELGRNLVADLAEAGFTLVRHETPRSFAANANLLLAAARAKSADLFLLNNDLVFTNGWLEPLLTDRRALLSPSLLFGENLLLLARRER